MNNYNNPGTIARRRSDGREVRRRSFSHIESINNVFPPPSEPTELPIISFWLHLDSDSDLVFRRQKLSRNKQELEGTRILARLNEYRKLDKNWDSYGAEAPSIKAINLAKTIINDIYSSSLPIDITNFNGFAGPLPNGGIRIYLDFNDKSLHITIPPDVEQSTILRITQENSSHRSLVKSDFECYQLREHLHWLLGNSQE